MNKKTQWFNNTLTNLTDEEIYLLGFLWADGYLNGPPEIKNNLQIEILFKDYQDIQTVFDKVGNWGRYIRKANIKNGVKRQKRIQLSISSRDLIRKFIKFDFDKKNCKGPDKLLKMIPKNKHHLFYRGYIDGDGCFYITKNANQFSISGTYNQDWSHIEKLFHRLKIKNYKINKKKNSKSSYSHIRTTSKESIQKISNYLYQDRLDIGLRRKQAKIENLLQAT